jgi:hypothetical protein
MRQLPWLVSIALPPLLIGSFLLFPGSLAWLTGFHPLHRAEGQNVGWDKTADEKGTPRFLAERNRVELVVPREMKVGDFLDLYQVRYEHIRLQIGSQLGIGRAGDEVVLAAGQKLTLEMTPPGAGT